MAALSIFTSAAQQAKDETDEHSLRAEIAKRFALGGGSSLAVAIVFGCYEVLRSNPRDAFPLLQSWGPKAIGCLIALYFGYDLIKAGLTIGTRAVVALEIAGAALQQTAEKNDRQQQETQTLTALTSQRTEKMQGLMHDMRNQMQDVADLMARVDRKLDQRDARQDSRDERDDRRDERRDERDERVEQRDVRRRDEEHGGPR